MAGNSVIGALRVNLGLDSAQFTAGLANAESRLGRFGKTAGAALGLVATAAAAATVAMGFAVKGAIDHADALSKSAQKAGVTTEALSRLAYAASYSDVNLESLTGSLGKLSKTMADASQNVKGPAASAFAALGISIKDASGNLRDSDAVFADISDRFSRLEDGSTKTALAMALFGKSGAQLIPLLNGGASQLKRYADEADRLGITLSTKTGRAAEEFNDTLSKVGQIMQGVANKVAEAALPALQHFADLLSSPAVAEAAQTLAVGIVTAFDKITEAVARAVGWFNAYKKWTEDNGRNLDGTLKLKLWKPESNNIEDRTSPGWSNLSPGGAAGQLMLNSTFDSLGNGKTFGSTKAMWDALTPAATNLGIFTDGIAKAQKAIDPFEARMNDLKDALTATVDPFSQMKLDLTDLQTMFDNGRISAAQFGDAVVKTAAGGVGAIADLAGGLTSALSDMFKKNKAIAVANAIVNGIGSVAKTFETYGATPWGFAAAGIAGVTAAANVASILSTSESSKSIPGGSGSTAGQAASAGARQGTINLTLRGSGSISLDDMMSQLSKQIADGGHQPFVKVMRGEIA